MKWPDRNISKRDPNRYYCGEANRLDLQVILGEKILGHIEELERLDHDRRNIAPVLAKKAYGIGRNVTELVQRAYVAGVTDLTQPTWHLQKRPGKSRQSFIRTWHFPGGYSQLIATEDPLLRLLILKRREVSLADKSFRMQRVTLPWVLDTNTESYDTFSPFRCQLTTKTIDTTSPTTLSFHYPFGILPYNLSREVELPDDRQEHARRYVGVMGELCRHLVLATRAQ